MNEEQVKELTEAMHRLSASISSLVMDLDIQTHLNKPFINLNGTILHVGSISSAQYHRATQALDIRWTNGSRNQYTGQDAERLWRALEQRVAVTIP